jgi:hypothetical protein
MQDCNQTPLSTTFYAQEHSQSSSPLSTDGLSPVSASGNFVSSPVTSTNNSLLSPAQISCSSNAPWILSGSSEREKVLVAFYERQSQQLKDDLARAKEEYAFLWYVSFILLILTHLII